jgi:hypothetical protein
MPNPSRVSGSHCPDKDNVIAGQCRSIARGVFRMSRRATALSLRFQHITSTQQTTCKQHA